MFKKFFTPEEANKRLPYIKRIVAEILANGKELRGIAEDYKGREVPEKFEILMFEIEALTTELEGLGCFYKDWNFEVGLVDFPALIDGKEVFLCWRSDEDQLTWCHGVDVGYSGRRLIAENSFKDKQ